MAELFGFSIKRVKDTQDPKQASQHHRRMMVHKPSPPVVILGNTLIWKVMPKPKQT
jgi:hypothetical protein